MEIKLSELLELAGAAKSQPSTASRGTSYKIVVLDKGFVVHGLVKFEDEYVVIDDCRCIRAWGTTAGLGQLATSGPTKDTKLDKQPTTRVHCRCVVQLIDSGGPWNA